MMICVLTLLSFLFASDTKEFWNSADDIGEKLGAMLRARLTTEVSVAPKEVRDLWLWYGMFLLPHALKESWGDAAQRKAGTLHKVVSISDEAYVLQMSLVRGNLAMERSEKGKDQEIQEPGRKCGRKKGDLYRKREATKTKDTVYMDYYEKVLECRKRSCHEIGWMQLLQHWENRIGGIRGMGGQGVKKKTWTAAKEKKCRVDLYDDTETEIARMDPSAMFAYSEGMDRLFE